MGVIVVLATAVLVTMSVDHMSFGQVPVGQTVLRRKVAVPWKYHSTWPSNCLKRKISKKFDVGATKLENHVRDILSTNHFI
jgi:hypothetical protein